MNDLIFSIFHSSKNSFLLSDFYQKLFKNIKSNMLGKINFEIVIILILT